MAFRHLAPVKGCHRKVVGITAAVNRHELVGETHFDDRVDIIGEGGARGMAASSPSICSCS